MLPMERRWAETILASFAPPDDVEGDAFAPRVGEVDYLRALDTMRAGATPLAAAGLRAAVWLVHFSPGALGAGAKHMGELSPAERARWLDRLSRHERFAFREATFVLKLVASLALFEPERLRRASGHEERAP